MGDVGPNLVRGWKRKFADGETVVVDRYCGPGLPNSPGPATVLRLDSPACWHGGKKGEGLYYVHDPERGVYPVCEGSMSRPPKEGGGR